MEAVMKTKLIFGSITAALIAFVVVMALRPLNDPGRADIDSKLEDIIFEDGKVNIYFFWGEGCPICSAQFEFFETIQDEYGKYFNLYNFEVWHNRDNATLLTELTGILGVTVGVLPYTIIGERTFSGFTSTMQNSIISAIQDQSNNDFDAYKIFRQLPKTSGTSESRFATETKAEVSFIN